MHLTRLLHSFLRFARTFRGSLTLGITSLLLIIAIATSKATAQNTRALPISQTAATQIQVLVQEKLSRTPAQRKLSSALLYAAKAKRRDALLSNVPSLSSFGSSNSRVRVAADGTVKVEIKTISPVTPDLLQQIQATGTQILSAPSSYNRVVALAPLSQLENLASLPAVLKIDPFIPPKLLRGTSAQEKEPLTISEPSPASQDVSNVEQVRERLATLPQLVQQVAQAPRGAITNAGSVTAEGDIAHGAALARSFYKVDGTGLKIGVLSDSFNNRRGAATDISKGDLPAEGVTLAGSGDLSGGGTDEGRAMLQIIHDLVPGAKLYFATAFNGQADFANNIRALRRAGCDIIVDDIIYYSEPAFQDGIIAQAVNEVTANGALYFSSAGNYGNKNDGTSGVWEGNFVDGGAAPLVLGSKGGTVHQFPNGSLFNRITRSTDLINLQWSDPLGKSTNDYDLYLLNPEGTAVVDAATDFQVGSSDPLERIFSVAPPDYQLIVVKSSGEPRYLHLNTVGGGLAMNTPGQTWGHSAAVGSFSVAAVSAQNRTTLFTGGAANSVETFSSDGPRRIFYRADGTPITPGNVLSTGGVVRQKPDIAAADGVKTSFSPFNPFFGTSAAAPNAAGVAALLKSFKPSLTQGQIRRILISTALDIEAPGVDQDSGYGIVMANRALQKATRYP